MGSPASGARPAWPESVEVVSRLERETLSYLTAERTDGPRAAYGFGAIASLTLVTHPGGLALMLAFGRSDRLQTIPSDCAPGTPPNGAARERSALVVALDSHLEIELSAAPDEATLTSAIRLNGQPYGVTLQADGFTLRSDQPLPLGDHLLEVEPPLRERRCAPSCGNVTPGRRAPV